MDATPDDKFIQDSNAPLKGADRVLAILKFLAFRENGASVKEVASEFNAPPSTVHRDLQTLCRSQLVEPRGLGTYAVSSLFFDAAAFGIQTSPITKFVQPILESIVSEMNETAHFAVRVGDLAMYRAKATPPSQSVKLNSRVGGTNPLYSTAVGKVLLAREAVDKQQMIDIVGPGPFVQRTSKTIDSADRLWAEVKATKQRGFAIDDEENEEGIFCVAIPIQFSHFLGIEDGALSVSGLVFRNPPNFVELAVETLRSAGTRVPKSTS